LLSWSAACLPPHLHLPASSSPSLSHWSLLQSTGRAVPHVPLPAFNAMSDPDLDSGWIQGVCADILSHTWPVRGGDQPRTTPMPFQRISTGLCGSPEQRTTPEEPRRGTGHLGHQNAAPTPHSRHPTRPGSCAAETTALGPTGWCPSGGAPRWRRPGPRRPEPRTLLCRNAQGPSLHQGQGRAAPHAIEGASGLPSYEINKKALKPFNRFFSLVSQFEHIAAIVVASGGLVPKPWLVQCMV
jgi:hypothetical protein